MPPIRIKKICYCNKNVIIAIKCNNNAKIYLVDETWGNDVLAPIQDLPILVEDTIVWYPDCNNIPDNVEKVVSQPDPSINICICVYIKGKIINRSG